MLNALDGLPGEQVTFISKNLDTAAEVKRSAPSQRVLWIVDTTPRWQIGGWAQGHRRGSVDGLDRQRSAGDRPVPRKRGWGITTDNTGHVREWLLNAGMTTAVGTGRGF